MSAWVLLTFAVCRNRRNRDSKNCSIFLLTTTTIHKFGLIKVTATITPVDSESLYVDGKVETSGSSISVTQVRKSTDKNWENYRYG